MNDIHLIIEGDDMRYEVDTNLRIAGLIIQSIAEDMERKKRLLNEDRPPNPQP